MAVPSVVTAAVTVVVLLVGLLSSVAKGEFTLTILHTNDVHARYDQFNKYGSPCSAQDADEDNCFGGYARLVTAVRELRREYPDSLLLDAGDQYQGTLWFYKYGGNVTGHFMNWLGYDVMALGNHEFDRGVEGLAPFLRAASFSVISANADVSRVPDVRNHVVKSVTRTVGGHKVGIVGYTTEDTPTISSPGDVTFSNVEEAVRREVEKLQSQEVDKVIALGHAGFTVDKRVAQIPGVDVVVGGHTDTFLYTGTPPSVETPEGDYPMVVHRDDGRGLVVQDFTFAKYVGVLHVTFTDDGHVQSYGGNPKLLDASVGQDNATLAELQPWRAGVEEETEKVVGMTLVHLEGSRQVCRLRECNLGNLVADGMVFDNNLYPDDKRWADVTISIMNGGGIRDSIERGQITIANVLSVLPFQNRLDAMEVKGEHVRLALEHSVARYTPCEQADLFGGFLQVSGLRVRYDMRRPVGQRVVTVHALCSRCLVPEFRPLNDSAIYKIILPSFLAQGGDGYSMLRDNAVSHDLLGELDSDAMIEYIENKSPIYQGLEDRIVYVDQSDDCTSGSHAPHATWTVLLVPVIFSKALR